MEEKNIYKDSKKHFNRFFLSIFLIEKTILILVVSGVSATILFIANSDVVFRFKPLLVLGVIFAMLSIIFIVFTMQCNLLAHSKVHMDKSIGKCNKFFIMLFKTLYIIFFISEGVLLTLFVMLNV